MYGSEDILSPRVPDPPPNSNATCACMLYQLPDITRRDSLNGTSLEHQNRVTESFFQEYCPEICSFIFILYNGANELQRISNQLVLFILI